MSTLLKIFHFIFIHQQFDIMFLDILLFLNLILILSLNLIRRIAPKFPTLAAFQAFCYTVKQYKM